MISGSSMSLNHYFSLAEMSRAAGIDTEIWICLPSYDACVNIGGNMSFIRVSEPSSAKRGA